MKQFTLAIVLFLSISASAQNIPTLVSYEIDTMCTSDYGFALVHTIQVEDLDMDSTYLIIMSYDNLVLNNVQAINPPYVPTATIRTFTIVADPGFSLSPGLNLSDIGFDIVGDVIDDGGAGFGVINDAAVYGNLTSPFNIMSLSLCKNDNPIDLRDYVSPAGNQSFSWNGGGSDANYMFNPGKFYDSGGGSVSYFFTNTAGCSGFAISSGPMINLPPSVSISPSTSTCGDADGTILSFVSGSGPFQVYWSTGFAETISSVPTTLSNLPAGNYYMNVTDANGCKAVSLAQISDIELSVSESYIPESCKMDSEDGGIDLTITPSGGTVNFIYWSNGQTTEDLTNVHYGEYTVEIRTDAGCEANHTYNVGVLTGMYVENVNSTDASCNISDGVVDYDVYNGAAPYTYLWNTGAVTPDLMGVPSGSYWCTVTDANGCKLEYKHDVATNGGPAAAVNYIKKPDCGQANGVINLDAYTFFAPITDISWSSGQHTEKIQNLTAGDYELTVTAQDGCVFNHTVRLKSEPPAKPSICMLTVDTSLVYNMIVWEKDLSQTQIAAYNIYRETSVYGNFELIATRPYALESFYQDNDASPIDRSWRYSISAVDNCQHESPRSFVHKTIHVVSNTSNAIDYDVHWDNYEGLTYSSANVFRHDDVNGWVSIDNVPFGSNTVMDTPPVLAGLDYMVEFVLDDPCQSTKVQDHNSSRSNKSASIFMPGGSTAQLKDVDLGVISIYPNPASDYFVIHIDQAETVHSFEIIDLSGNLVYRGAITTNTTNVATGEMAAGIYMVKIYSADKVITQKLVLN